MSRILRFACVGAAVVGLASVGNAQVCAGTPALSTNSLRIGGTAMFSGNSSTAYGGNASLAVHDGWYLSGDFSHAKDNNSDGSSNAGGGSLSYEWPHIFPGAVHVCSTVGAEAQSGSVVGTLPVATPRNTVDLHFGGSMGWVASSSSSMQVIPTLGAAWIRRSNSYKIQYSGKSYSTTSYNFGMVTGAIGFVFDKQWTVSPMVQVPISEYQGKPAYGVGLSYQFGWHQHGK